MWYTVRNTRWHVRIIAHVKTLKAKPRLTFCSVSCVIFIIWVFFFFKSQSKNVFQVQRPQHSLHGRYNCTWEFSVEVGSERRIFRKSCKKKKHEGKQVKSIPSRTEWTVSSSDRSFFSSSHSSSGKKTKQRKYKLIHFLLTTLLSLRDVRLNRNTMYRPYRAATIADRDNRRSVRREISLKKLVRQNFLNCYD